MNRVQVIPLTSNIERLYPSESYVTVGQKKSKAMTDQIATVSKTRVMSKVGFITTADLAGVERALCTHLGLIHGS